MSFLHIDILPEGIVQFKFLYTTLTVTNTLENVKLHYNTIAVRGIKTEDTQQ
jgi:hypothetical protein